MLDGNAGRGEPVDPDGPRQRAQAMAPRGVREYVHPVELYERSRMPDPGDGGVVMIPAKGLDIRSGDGQRGELARAARDARQAQEVESEAGPVRGAVKFRIQVVECPLVLRGPRQLRSRMPPLEIGHDSPGSAGGKKHPGENEDDGKCRRAS